LIFLSYAEEDRGAAETVVAALRQHEVQVYNWTERRGTRFIGQMEEQLAQATGYLALMSPHFLASAWCRRELELALVRDNESGLDPAQPFIHVISVGEVIHRDAGFLHAYEWVNLADVENLVTRLAEPAPAPAASISATGSVITRPWQVPETSIFRNRQDELDRVIQGLRSLAGNHFWLVIAPPQLGKSNFLGEIARLASADEDHPWGTRLINLRDLPADRRNDVGLILGQLFGHDLPVATDSDSLGRIAQDIIGGRRQQLCLLDSAELLDRTTARRLRICFSQIYDDVRMCGDVNVRLALIVASRRDDEWLGVTPVPRLEAVKLTEFKQNVVAEALRNLAGQMERNFPPETARRQAELVQTLSEGLPALLVACLSWIRDDQWVRLNQWTRSDRPADAAVFAQLAYPYIEKGLLSQDSLMPGETDSLEYRMTALDQSLRVLTPYRLFTQSHLRHHLGLDRQFNGAMRRAGWELEGLWRAISGTALLARPLSEPWQVLDGTVRRLLFRYYYRSDSDKTSAHRRARQYVQEWVQGQTGTEQVVGLIECLWHEAEILRINSPARMDSTLSRLARSMFSALQPSLIYSEMELRNFGARRIHDDDELAATLSGVDGLLDKLAEIVERLQEP
jgi:hypothetical protein